MDTIGKAISIAAVAVATAVPLRGTNNHGVYQYKPVCARTGTTTLEKCGNNLTIDSASVKGSSLFLRMKEKGKGTSYKFSAYDGNTRMELRQEKRNGLVISGVRKYMVVTLTAVGKGKEKDFSMFITK